MKIKDLKKELENDLIVYKLKVLEAENEYQEAYYRGLLEKCEEVLSGIENIIEDKKHIKKNIFSYTILAKYIDYELLGDFVRNTNFKTKCYYKSKKIKLNEDTGYKDITFHFYQTKQDRDNSTNSQFFLKFNTKSLFDNNIKDFVNYSESYGDKRKISKSYLNEFVNKYFKTKNNFEFNIQNIKNDIIIDNNTKDKQMDKNQISSINDLKTSTREDLKEIKKFETKDKYTFDTEQQAIEHQNKINIINYIGSLLGGINVSDSYKGFLNGEGYIVLDNEKLLLASKLIQEFKDELGFQDYGINSRACYDNKDLNKLSSIVSCIGLLNKTNQNIRVGQPYYIKNQHELGNIVYNVNELKKSDLTPKLKNVIKVFETILKDYSENNMSKDEFKKEFNNKAAKIETILKDRDTIKEKHVLKLDDLVEKYADKNTSILTKKDYVEIENELNKLKDFSREARAKIETLSIDR